MILLVDVYSIANQMPKSLANLCTSRGMNSGHVFSFMKHLKEMRKFKASKTVFIFDRGYNHRSAIDSNYKGNRFKNHNFSISGDIEPWLSSLPCTIMCKNGYETDDIIYTIVKNLKDDSEEVVILSKDYDISFNLIYYPKVRHFLTLKHEVTVTSLMLKEGCFPGLLPLYKAVFGDVSDNIPSIGLDRKVSAEVKGLFKKDASYETIIKAIPKCYIPKVRKNFELTTPVTVSDIEYKECPGNKAAIETVLKMYEIKSISADDLF